MTEFCDCKVFPHSQAPALGNVEFWLAKLLARLAEQTSRSGGLSKQENGFETLSQGRGLWVGLAIA